MPELPEVEVVRAGLEPAVASATITFVEVLDERSLRRHSGPSEDFVDRLVGATFQTPRRRGKFIWLPLALRPSPELVEGRFDRLSERVSFPERCPSPERAPSPEPVEGDPVEAVVVHLGMSGQVLLRQPGALDPLTRIRIEIFHPQRGPMLLNFVDQRIFGSMAIDDLVATTDAPGQVPSQVAHIARDPLDPLFDDALFFRRLAARRSGIKRALLDQTLISGIGNIYADEALWAARVHYDQPATSLSRGRARRLLSEVRQVLTRALIEGGTSFDTQYLNVNGESGYFARSLQAYGQHGDPCSRCGRTIIRESFMNRGSHFCPHCQRLRAPVAPRASL